MLYELRHYDIRSERGLDQVTGRFGDHILPIWDRLGVRQVGFWSVIIGTPSPRLTYMLAWDDLAQRQELWDAFEADDEWQKARRETRAAWGGDQTHTISTTILKPTDFSRQPTYDNQPARLAGGIFELRTHCFDDGGRQAQTLEAFRSQIAPAYEKHGMYAMGHWTTYLGTSPRLTSMLVFENLAHRERAWASFYTAPEWPARQEMLYADGQPLMTRIDSCAMKGTDFSGWR